MNDLTHEDEQDLVLWNPLVPGVPEVRLKPMKSREEKPSGKYCIPIKVVRKAEITHAMKQQIMKILMDDKTPSGHEVRAALWLEEQLDNACSKSECHNVVRLVKKTYKSLPSRNDPPICVRLSGMFWVDEQTLYALMPVRGVYRMDKPGSMGRTIEFNDQMPSREAIKAMESGLEYDDFQKDSPKQGGSLVAVDSQPAPSPSHMAGPMPSRDARGRRKL